MLGYFGGWTRHLQQATRCTGKHGQLVFACVSTSREIFSFSPDLALFAAYMHPAEGCPTSTTGFPCGAHATVVGIINTKEVEAPRATKVFTSTRQTKVSHLWAPCPFHPPYPYPYPW